MFPPNSSLYSRNNCSGNLEKLSRCLLRQSEVISEGQDEWNIGFNKLRGPPFRSSFHSQFFSGICNVVDLRSEKEVSGTYAGWIVSIWTIVAHLKSFWYWSKVKNPTRPAREYGAVPDGPYPSPSLTVLSSVPNPARIGDRYFGKKPFGKRLGKTLLFEILCGNPELIRVTHNNAVHAVGRLLAVAAAFLLSTTTNQKSTL